ncbi:glutathione S-transferase T3-like protein [Tanacetum coccineum]
MRILECLQQASDLKINSNKSKVYGIGVSNVEVDFIANRMGCSPGRMPFTYLGIPIGTNMRRIASWNEIIDKFRKRLSVWKAKYLSFGGRLTLVKSVHAKWRWRFRVEENRPWVKIVKSIYGEDGGLTHDGRSSRSGGSKWVDTLKSWRWVRNPRGRGEGELIELTTLINFFVPNMLQDDSWRWLLDANDGRFTVKMLRELIDEKILHSTDGSQETKWNKAVPRKVCIMIWRLQQRRLPVLSWLHHIDIDLNSSLCPHCAQPSETQFKVPQGKDLRDGRRKQKKGKQPVVDLDEDDDDDMPGRRNLTRWNKNEEMLLAETWIEHSQDANIGKDQQDDVYWNLIMQDFNSRTKAPPRTKNMMTGKWTRMHGHCQMFNAIYKYLTRKSGENDADLVENAKTTYIERYGNKKIQYVHVWNILKNYPKWNAAEPIDEDNLQELFGPDPRERPADKQRASKKQKSDYKRKCDAAERTYEAKREKELAIMKKELAIMQCKELEFLMLDPSSLPPAKRAIIEKKQAEIMKKYPDA